MLGYSAEADDVPTFAAMGFGPVSKPPLNWDVGRPTGFAIATSTVSPEAAQEAATARAVFNAQQTWTPPGGTPSVIPNDNDIMTTLEAAGVEPLT